MFAARPSRISLWRRDLRTRFCQARGCSVLGVDLSSGMVERARMNERAAPLGIRYQVGDAASLGTLGAFDLVVASLPVQLRAHGRRTPGVCSYSHGEPEAGWTTCRHQRQPVDGVRRLQSYANYGFRATWRRRCERVPVSATPSPSSDGTTFGFDQFLAVSGHLSRALCRSGIRGLDFVQCQATLDDSQKPGFLAGFSFRLSAHWP